MDKQFLKNFKFDIHSITSDSRKAGNGVIFVAIKGTKSDGHDFIHSAIEAGSNIIVCEKIPDGHFPNIEFIKVSDSAEALGYIADIHYGSPSAQMKLVGVTGTNGKTTVATLLYRLAMTMGYKVGLFSTVAIYINNEKYETANTTPDALTLNAIMRKMVDAGCQYCFMEVSSHAVVQKRIAGLKYKGAVFTNLTHDHLDYHGSFEIYRDAKKEFFDGLEKQAFALVNFDDKNGMVMIQNSNAEKYTYSLREMADFNMKTIEIINEGMLLSIKGKEFWTPLIGKFNAYNLAAVYGVAELLGWQQEDILINISKLKSVDGRVETIRIKDDVTVIVDYAHTPDALKNIIEAVNSFRKKGNRLIVVVGAGGNRDKTKRPKMAKEASNSTDIVILTSDNPRDENPEDIINQMIEGVPMDDRNKILSIVNRREAIRTACKMANKNDIVLIAGKGHETYQEINGVKYPFDDREIVKEFCY
ncbi:MAG: UDP-N-acetylmuramoyl-L-alanyl-D-glutamate--2,6-diaminopimelate ligase [Marinilabiliaceae bacterium]|nr:UDP-N-acetylmuramoyl-L-alanyl-D-glutamate--2,6-diaminopimelate ligase [Marinilabiliaceae bacterium]